MPEWISYYAGLIAKGLQTTLSLLVISAVLGFALAVLVALARLSRRKWLARCALGYTSVLRGTPLLIQIYIFYYGLGSLFAQFPMIRGSFLLLVLQVYIEHTFNHVSSPRVCLWPKTVATC